MISRVVWRWVFEGGRFRPWRWLAVLGVLLLAIRWTGV